MNRKQQWVIGVASFLILVFVALYFLNWNLLRPYISAKVTQFTGRSFAINGDLIVHLSLHPRIVANDIVLGNAAWSAEPNMAEIKRLDVRVDLLQLLIGHLNFPDIALSAPHVILEVNKDGTPNWVFKGQHKDKSTGIPEVGALAIDHGSAIYRDPRTNTQLTIEVNTLDGQQGPESMLEVSGKGLFKGMPSTVVARGGALLSLRNADSPYPIKAHAELGTTKVSVDGRLIDPLHLRGENLNFTLEGSDLELLYPLVGVPIPPTPPYKISGALNHAGDVWALRQFKGVVGKSDLRGDVSVDVSQKPQFIKADLVSNNLDMADLGGFIGADRGGKPADKPPPSNKLLPTEPFSLEKLRSANADVKFRAARIMTLKSPLEKMDVHMLVDNGTLKLAPLNFSVAGGSLETQIQMDGREQRIATHAEILAKGLHLDKLMPMEKMRAVSSGTMGGRAKLVMTGNSVSQMLGSANGEAALIMTGGTVSELALRLSNLDIANSLARLIVGDKQTPIRCMVSNLHADNGDFRIKAMVLDTPKVNLHGTGDVNFRTEVLNVRLTAESKSFSLASLRGPINISGTLKSPTVHAEMGNVITRAGLAAALGSVTAGIGALIPLLEFGKEEQSHCTELIAQAKAEVGVKASDMAPRTPARKR
ncbi:MAG: AsmA family protein [Polaromonas sp.]